MTRSNNDVSAAVSRVANHTYKRLYHGKLPEYWWDHLDDKFHQYPDHFDLDCMTQSMVSSSAVFDRVLRTAVASAVASLALPFAANPKQIKFDFDHIAFYQSMAEAGDVHRFFKTPSERPVIKESPASLISYRPTEGTVKELSFVSPFKTVNPEYQSRYDSNKENQVAKAQFWQHEGGPRPTICVIHGFMADPYWLNRIFFALPWYYKKGYNILLYTWPFHGSRQKRCSPFSGHGLFAGGVNHINEAFAQAIYDLRLFMSFLREQKGVEKIGVTGISLGGYTSALLACIDDQLEFSIPIVPLVSIADIALNWFPTNVITKASLAYSGHSVGEFRQMLAVHSPLSYQPVIPKDRLMVIGGAGDRFAPPKHSGLLWEHWDQCQLHWFPGSHLIHLDQGKYLREIAQFMKEIDFV